MLIAGLFFLIAVAVGSLAEYLLHRYFLHSRLRHWVVRRHKLHHKTYTRHSVASEFLGSCHRRCR